MSPLLRGWSAALLCAVATIGSTSSAGAEMIVPDGGFALRGSTAEIIAGVDAAHAAGARWVSLGATWASLEPAPDSYLTPGGPGSGAWSELETRLTYAKAKGMNVELRLNDAPAWASGRQGTDDPPTPANVGEYGRFLTDLANRLGPLLDAYSPWNEPNLARFWNPVSPEAYTALQKEAYTSIKSVDPSATVLSAAIVGRYGGQNSGYAFLRRAYQAGLRGNADVIGWNGYPGGEPESDGPVQGGIPAGNTLPGQFHLRELIDEFDPGRRVWIMEMSWSTCIACTASAANGVTESAQADYLQRAYTYRRRYLGGITDRIFWYQLRDEGTDRSDWFQNQGVLRHDLSPKPALAAFRSLRVDVPTAGPGGAGDGSAAGGGPPAGLPPAAARLGLPVASGTSAGRVVIGRARIGAKRGTFTLAFKVGVTGGVSSIRVEGYRARRWRLISRVKVPRSGLLTVRFRDKAYVGLRIRATVPGQSGLRVGRIVKIPPRLIGGRR